MAGHLRRAGFRGGDQTLVANDQIVAHSDIDRIAEASADDDIVTRTGGNVIHPADVPDGRLDPIDVGQIAVAEVGVCVDRRAGGEVLCNVERLRSHGRIGERSSKHDEAMVADDDIVSVARVDRIAADAAKDDVVILIAFDHVGLTGTDVDRLDPLQGGIPGSDQSLNGHGLRNRTQIGEVAQRTGALLDDAVVAEDDIVPR